MKMDVAIFRKGNDANHQPKSARKRSFSQRIKNIQYTIYIYIYFFYLF